MTDVLQSVWPLVLNIIKEFRARQRPYFVQNPSRHPDICFKSLHGFSDLWGQCPSEATSGAS
eukprot:COSAG02_NODE_63_length_43286_cov_54.666412_8_plen_62_part_00